MASSNLQSLRNGGMLETVFNNFKGLSRRSDRLNTSPQYIYDLLNGYIKKEASTGLGIVLQREGSSKLNSVQLSAGIYGSATAKIKTVYEAKWNGGGTDVIIRAGTAWGKFDGVNTFDALDTGRSDDVYGHAVMFKNQLLMVDGGTPRKCTSAYVVTDLTTVTNGTVTVTIASPAVFSFVAHGFVAGQAVKFTTTGALPTGLTAGTTYYVISAGLTADAFEVSATLGGTAVNTSGSQSGTHTLYSFDANMPTDANAIWVHRDKVWLNSASNPMKAYYSKTNSANTNTSFTGSTDAGTIDLSTVLPDGDTILGYRTYGGIDTGLIAIICSKYTVIYSAGANVYDFTFVQYFPSTCASINGCDYVGKDIVYPSINSFTSLLSTSGSDSLEVKTLSEEIELLYRQLIQSLTDTNSIVGMFDKTLNLFYLLFPIQNNQQVLVYSVDIGNFVGRWTYPFNMYSMYYRKNGNVLAGGDGFVYLLNNGTDDVGTAISWKLAMPALYFGTPSRYKKPIEFEGLLQNSTNMTLYLDYWYGIASLNNSIITKQIDLSSSSSFWDESLWDVSYWDTGGNNLHRTSDLIGRGRLMFIELRHSTQGASIAIPWFIIRYIMEGVN